MGWLGCILTARKLKDAIRLDVKLDSERMFFLVFLFQLNKSSLHNFLFHVLKLVRNLAHVKEVTIKIPFSTYCT